MYNTVILNGILIIVCVFLLSNDEAVDAAVIAAKSVERFRNKRDAASDTDFRKVALDLHNQYRKAHGAPPVAFDEKLNKESQAWAEEIIKTKSKLKFKSGSGFIQNLFEFSGKGQNVPAITKKAIESWYGGKSSYNPKSPDTTYSAFTLMVWKATKTIGVGVATANDRYVVVAAYSPPGNVFMKGNPTKLFNENVQL